ncbi:hypothetical protein CBF29_01520 [Vagococcus elongatus]|uniref:Uncharacterized protein n=1 Tax=Vagococcus elongatus TaxID=180344 RepID=A0A430B3Y4_9ENTE|nr:hypothetical protein CBF29_01520 [Vagococcus elongatus]
MPESHKEDLLHRGLRKKKKCDTISTRNLIDDWIKTPEFECVLIREGKRGWNFPSIAQRMTTFENLAES